MYLFVIWDQEITQNISKLIYYEISNHSIQISASESTKKLNENFSLSSSGGQSCNLNSKCIQIHKSLWYLDLGLWSRICTCTEKNLNFLSQCTEITRSSTWKIVVGSLTEVEQGR